MADDQSTDLLMLLTTISGGPIESDCQTDFNALTKLDQRKMVQDFKPATGSTLANFFEIEDVDLGFNMRPSGKGPAGDTYALDMGEITVDRKIDRSSMTLMNAVWTATPFEKAVIIKRRATGTGVSSATSAFGAQSGEAYLRLEFDGVLITKIDWNDGHAVKEKITFITRGVKMIYRAQQSSGILQGSVSGQWKMPDQ